MSNIVLKAHSATETVGEVALTEGVSTKVKAQKKVNYELLDQDTGHAPQHIVTKRVGNDLHISLDKDGQSDDLIIEGYYDNGEAALIGLAEDGQYYYYIPDTGEVADYVTQLAAGDVEGQALGGQAYTAPWWVGATETKAGILPWLVGLAAIGGIAALAGKDDKDSKDNNTTPAKEKTTTPTVNIENKDTDGNGADDTTTISGKTDPNATVEIKDKDGNVIKTVTADNDGNYTADVPVLNQGDKVTVVATAPGKDPSAPGTGTVPAVDTAETTATPTVVVTNEDTDGNGTHDVTRISGKTEPNAKVTITLPDGTTVTTTADNDGNYTADVPVLNKDDVVKVVATAPGKDPSNEATGTVPEVNTTPNDTKIPGDSNGDGKVDDDDDSNNHIIIKDKDGKDIVVPRNTDGKPNIVFIDDVNGDGKLNKDEIGTDDKVTVAITIPDNTEAGDTVIVTINGKQEKVVLTDEDIKKGYIEKTVDTKDADGNTLEKIEVTAKVVDPAGNESKEGSKTATIDTVAPSEPKSVTIGDNGDEYITKDEIKDGKVDVTVELPDDAKPGDKVKVVDQDGKEYEKEITQDDIDNGKVTVPVDAPDEGEKLEVKVTIEDDAGNESGDKTADATRDTKSPGDANDDGKVDDEDDSKNDDDTDKTVDIPVNGGDDDSKVTEPTTTKGAPNIVFVDDANQDGTLNAQEVGTDGKTTVAVTIPEGTEAGDSMVLTFNGVEQEPRPISAEDIARGYFLAEDVPTVNDAGEKLDQVEVKAYVKDAAGNQSNQATKAVTLDTTAPDSSSTQLAIDDVTEDNTINAAESKDKVTITGKATGEFTEGDEVTLTINGTEYKGNVDADGKFSIEVEGSDLAADTDKKIDAVLVATDAAGNKGNITADKTYTVDTKSPGDANDDGKVDDEDDSKNDDDTDKTVDIPVNGGDDDSKVTEPTTTKGAPNIVFVDDANQDGTLNAQEVGTDGKTTVAVTIPEGTEAGDSMVLTFNGVEQEPRPISAEDIARGYFLAEDVPTVNDAGEKLDQVEVKAYVKDAAGNQSNQATKAVTLDSGVPGDTDGDGESDLGVMITVPESDDGYVNISEAKDGVQVVTTLPAGFADTVQPGDVVTLTVTAPDGTATKVTHALTADDIAKGKFVVTIPADQVTEQGEYTTTAVVTDKAGNQSVISNEAKFNVDTVAPEVDITSIAGQEQSSEDGNVIAELKPYALVSENIAKEGFVISGTAADKVGTTAEDQVEATATESGVAGQTVVVRIFNGDPENGGEEVATYAAIVQADGTWSVDIAPKLVDSTNSTGDTVKTNEKPDWYDPETAYIIKAEVSDAAGNSTLDFDKTRTPIAITAVKAGDDFFDDYRSGDVRTEDENAKTILEAIDSNYETTYKGEISGFTDSDSAVSLDTGLTNDATPDISISLNRQLENGETLKVVRQRVSDNGIQYDEVEIDISDATIVENADGTVTYTFTDDLAETYGTTYTYTAKVVDTNDVELTNNQSHSIHLDTRVDILTPTSITTGNTNNGYTYTWTGTTEANATIQINYLQRDGSWATVDTTSDAQGNFQFALMNWQQQAIDNGTITITDAAGNIQTANLHNIQRLYVNMNTDSAIVTDSFNKTYLLQREGSGDDALLMSGDNDWVFLIGGGTNDLANQAPLASNTLVDMADGDDLLFVNGDINANVKIDLGAGNDKLVVNGGIPAVPGEQIVDLGTGDNYMYVKNGQEYKSGGSQILAADGNDYVEFGSNILGVMKMDLGDGENSVLVRGYTSFTEITTGSGVDHVNITDYARETTIDLGDGNNLLEVGSNFAVNSKLNTGSGNDTIKIDGYVAAVDVFNTGAGDDTVTIGSNIDYTNMNLGDGDDVLNIGGYILRSTVETGAGDDTVMVNQMGAGASTAASNRLFLGEGDDTVTVNKFYNGNTNTFIDGGDGHDIANLNGSNETFRITQLLNIEEFNLTGNSVKFDISGADWITQVTDGKNSVTEIYVKGDNADTVDLGANGNLSDNGVFQDNSAAIDNNKTWWQKGDTTKVDGVEYTAYTFTDSGTTVTVHIQEGITII